MSHIVVMCKEILWSLSILVLFSALAAYSHKWSQGLSCVNDFVNNVSCTWNSTAVAPGVDCWIYGVMTNWTFENGRRLPKQTRRECKLKQQENSPPGCSFVFENEEFDFFDNMPIISVKCNGTSLENLTDYQPCRHVKLNPPGVPSISSTANETWVSWSPGSPVSEYIINFDFQVQIKLKKQTWKEGRTLSTQQQQIKIPAYEQKGHCQVRVRVKTSDCDSHWSNWSPTTTWMGAADETTTSLDQDWLLNHISQVVQGVALSMGAFVVILVIFYLRCRSKRHIRVKPIPNPSRYFPTLHSVHGGNLKKWLNPLSASELFFTAVPHDLISPVEVCETWDVVPSTSPSSSSTSALFHIRSFPSTGSDVVGDKSSASSCFSNIGYFMSNASSSLAQTDPSPAYFTYKDDHHKPPNSHHLHLSFCPSLTTSQAYESLKREPQSPDSGFGIGQEDEEDDKNEKGMDLEEPLLILPWHPPSWVCPPSSVSPPPHPPSLTQICLGNQELDDEPQAAACAGFVAWPVASSMCRSSSMPVEPCKTGYLTLKELQTTFSNKSI